MILALLYVDLEESEVDLGSSLMFMQTLLKKLLFLLVKRISEMLTMENVLHYLPQREQKKTWWNIGFTQHMELSLYLYRIMKCQLSSQLF